MYLLGTLKDTKNINPAAGKVFDVIECMIPSPQPDTKTSNHKLIMKLKKLNIISILSSIYLALRESESKTSPTTNPHKRN